MLQPRTLNVTTPFMATPLPQGGGLHKLRSILLEAEKPC